MNNMCLGTLEWNFSKTFSHFHFLFKRLIQLILFTQHLIFFIEKSIIAIQLEKFFTLWLRNEIQITICWIWFSSYFLTRFENKLRHIYRIQFVVENGRNLKKNHL